MSGMSALSGALNYLPAWLSDGPEAVALDTLLCGWVKASGWQTAGLVLPTADGMACVLATANTADRSAVPPAELSEVQKSQKAGATTVVWQRPATSGRLYTAITPTGRPSGVVWAERAAAEPWTEPDRAAFRLAARLIERSPALTELTGPVIDPQRVSQRLADAATMCGRMAHDFDNVLTGIIGFTELTTPLLVPGSQPARYLGEIGKVGQRGVLFTQQLHQLSRSGQARPQPGAIPAAVAREEARVRATCPYGVTVQSSVPANLALVAMDTTPLGQVIGHLLDNAVQACLTGGRVTITARGCDLTATDARGFLGAVAPGPHVEVVIQDTGVGVKSDIRPRLFLEPFVTTKAGRRGLGLTIVYRTLAAHKGGIRLETGDPGTLARCVVPVTATRPAIASSSQLTPALGAEHR